MFYDSDKCAHIVTAWVSSLTWTDIVTSENQLQSEGAEQCILTVDRHQMLILEVGLDNGLTRATYYLRKSFF